MAYEVMAAPRQRHAPPLSPRSALAALFRASEGRPLTRAEWLAVPLEERYKRLAGPRAPNPSS